MIVSASRRTDAPALYAPWLLGRIEAGYACVVNPFDSAQVRQVDLRPAPQGAMDALVLWTRNPAPLLPALPGWERRGVRSVWLVTVTGYPRLLEPNAPDAGSALAAVCALAAAVGPARVVWRYDPVLLSPSFGLTADWHRRNFAALAAALQGAALRCIVSVYDPYRKAERRLAKAGLAALPAEEARHASLQLLADLAETAAGVGMELRSCCEELEAAGIPAGACIDGRLLDELWGLDLGKARDPGQRKNCRCAPAVDIGAYDTCTHGCLYCYATGAPERAAARRTAHAPQAERLT